MIGYKLMKTNTLWPLISIIIPIYKVEPYLCCCVDSVLSQTFRNLEIILVDDGSPDHCPILCDEYAAKDPRIKVIHKQNGGLSDARNAGMAVATGHYLMFVDSDDWLEQDAVETLFQLLRENKAQLAIGGMQRAAEDDANIILQSDRNGSSQETSMTSLQAMQDFFRKGCAAWGRLFCREIHNGIEFPVGEINEDEAIVLRLLDRCHTVAQTNKVIYHYRLRSESITTACFSEKKLAWYRHCEQNLNWVRQFHPELEIYAADRLCSSILWSLTEIALSDKAEPMWINELKVCLRKNYSICRKAYRHGIKQTIRLLTLRYLPFSMYRTAIRKKRKA